jgi:thiamine-phosphate pyrophosphorylase
LTPSSWSASSNARSSAASKFSLTCKLPRLYPILDAGLLLQAGLSIESFAQELRSAGIRFLQYRDKDSQDDLVLERAAMLRRIFPSLDSCLILNDRVSLLQATRFEGVHVGQEDQSPADTRAALGPDILIGVSTHGEAQLLAAAAGPADYVAIGPVYATLSKKVPDPVVGLEAVRLARAMTTKPLVAIGGIGRANCSAVIDAGADSVAVISDLLPTPTHSTAKRIEEFLATLTS